MSEATAHPLTANEADLSAPIRKASTGPITRETYSALKQQLAYGGGLWPALLVIAVDWLLIAACVALLARGTWLAYAGSQVLLAIVFFHNFGLVHEAGHGNCSRKRWVNTLIGHYASVLCFLPFFPWKHIHTLHHVWVGNPDKDPTTRNVRIWREQKRVPWLIRASWRGWIPLGALSQHVVYWTYPIRLLREDKREVLRSTISVALLPLSYALLAYLVPGALSWRTLGPALLIYLFATELVNVPHHVDLFKFKERLPLWDQWKASRSCYYPVLVSELLVLNFNFHIEHHLFPGLPWFQLRRARQLVRAQLGDAYRESIGIQFNLENRSRDMERLLLVE
jgi:fatty acid desaturase